MDLGNKIAKLRKKAGYSQEQLADKMGVSRQSVFKWESGGNIPDIEKIKKLADLFHVSLNDLLDDEVDIDAPIATSADVEQLEKSYKRLKGWLIGVSCACAVSLGLGIASGTILITRSNSTQVAESSETSKSLPASYFITLDDIVGTWRSGGYVWKINEYQGYASVLYSSYSLTTWQETKNGTCLGSSSIKGFDEENERQLINLSNATASGEFYEISAYKSVEQIITFAWGSEVFQKIGAGV